MMPDEERLTVRLSSDDILLLRELVFQGMFPNEAEAVRKAVSSFLSECFSDKEMEDLLQKAKSRKVPDLSLFTSDGRDAGKTLNNVIFNNPSDNGEE